MRILLCLLLLVSAAGAQTNVIYDDDCANDVDCAVNFSTLNKLADFGELNILATVSSSQNVLSAPAMHVFNTYYGRPSLTVGANQQNTPACSNSCNTSTWLSGLISAFDAGDTRANYPNCVTVYRTALAARASADVTIVETGFATCLTQLLASPADGISPLTGAQLVQAKVAKLVVMGGVYTSGTEWNFQSDASEFSSLFTTWTTANGYPPIWFVSFADCSPRMGPPSTAPTTNPIKYAFNQAGISYNGSCDAMGILYAARGLSSGYWTDSGNGTNSVNGSTGANTFSTGTASGHHYLINALSDYAFQQILDGYTATGLAGLNPLVGKGVFYNSAVY